MKKLLIVTCFVMASSSVMADELISVEKVKIGNETVSLPTTLKSSTKDVCVTYIESVTETEGAYSYKKAEYCGKAIPVKDGFSIKHSSYRAEGLLSLRWVPTKDGKAGVHNITTESNKK